MTDEVRIAYDTMAEHSMGRPSMIPTALALTGSGSQHPPRWRPGKTARSPTSVGGRVAVAVMGWTGVDLVPVRPDGRRSVRRRPR